MHHKTSIKNEGSLFEVVLNTVSDGVTVLDKELRIKYQNKTITQIYGESLIGEQCYKVYRGRKEPCEDCKVIEVLKDGQERRIFRDISLPNGDTLLIEVSSAAVKDEEGKIIGAVEVARDVTEQKKAEALLNQTLLERNEDLSRLKNELSSAAGYIKTVLPRPITKGPLRTDWRFIPSVSLGGDSFGYHWIDDDHFAIYVLDVSGHGWGAALLSVSVINVLRSHALPETDFRIPQQVLYGLNHTFPGEKHNDMFFTIWYGVYHRPSHNLAYASGGHPPALLLYGSSSEKVQIDQLRTPNFVIGGQPDITFQQEIKKFDGSACLYVFSDGVYDIVKTDDSIWGFDAFLDFMTCPSQTGSSALDRLLDYAQDLTQTDTFEDDFTILEVAFE
jgi:PAS domain S-box-containing protein